jgi:hypothetical protein
MTEYRTFFCLIRENPFRVYFLGWGFERPRRDESRKPRSFDSEIAAREIKKHLRGEPVLIERRSKVLKRMKEDYDV